MWNIVPTDEVQGARTLLSAGCPLKLLCGLPDLDLADLGLAKLGELQTVAISAFEQKLPQLPESQTQERE